MNSGKIVAGQVDGTGRDIEGSTRGPRGPKKSGLKKKSLTGREREEGEREGKYQG